MKVIKLDRRHRLYKEGFTHAFRFTSWESARPIESYYEKKYGYSWDNDKCFGTFWGKPTVAGRIFWIGVRNEALVTQALLAVKTPS